MIKDFEKSFLSPPSSKRNSEPKSNESRKFLEDVIDDLKFPNMPAGNKTEKKNQ